MKNLLRLLLLSVVLWPGKMLGDDTQSLLRPVTSAYTFNWGQAQVADTYLSPLIYNGWNVGFSYSRMQAMKFSPQKWVMELTIGVNGSRTRNKAKNAVYWQGELNAEWAMMHRWRFPFRLTVGVGGFTGIQAGAIYTTRNGNNPVAAKGSWFLGPKAYATYGFRIRKTPALVRWEGSMPAIGMFFSPQFGELYYEMYLGNRKGLIHPAWFGNFVKLNNEVSIDFNFGSAALRVGYKSTIYSTQVNHITTRIVTNSLMLGVVTEWMSLRHSRVPGENTRVISALY